jgi:hypothetical protein
MRHADDGLLNPGLAAVLHQLVEQWDQAVAAFEREALLADILGMEITLQAFRRGQLPENVFLLLGAEAILHARHLKAVLQPQALFRVRNMGELRADGVGVNEFQIRQNILQLGALGDGVVAAAGEKLGLQIGIRQPEILQVEHIGLRTLLQAQRIEIGNQVATIHVHLNETRYRALLGARTIRRAARGAAACVRQFGARHQSLAYRAVGNLAAALEAGEVLAPSGVQAARIP